MTEATTVAAYLDALAPERRELVVAILGVIRDNLDPAFAEGMQYGMPAFFLPHSVYPAGYHCDSSQPLPFASVAATKGGASIYLFCVYTDEAVKQEMVDAWKATGLRLDMGKSCIRVRSLDKVPLEVIGTTIAGISAEDFVAAYERGLPKGARKGR